MFKIHKEEIEINGKKITLETGKIAVKQMEQLLQHVVKLLSLQQL